MVQLVGRFPEALLTGTYKLDKAACGIYSAMVPKQPATWAKRFPDTPASGTRQRA